MSNCNLISDFFIQLFLNSCFLLIQIPYYSPESVLSLKRIGLHVVADDEAKKLKLF